VIKTETERLLLGEDWFWFLGHMIFLADATLEITSIVPTHSKIRQLFGISGFRIFGMLKDAWSCFCFSETLL
jgi:hypothetical protein